MIRRHLGPTIDIHGGGSDLTFPHHENELAQGTCVEDGEQYVRYWMHNGMLRFGAEKMSKSVGNIVTIRALLAEHSGETLRYALLSGHYRQGLDWSDRLLEQARASLDSLYQALLAAPDTGKTSAAWSDVDIGAFPESVLEPLCDDLNTPRALAALHAIAAEIHAAGDEAAAAAARDRLLAGGWLLGLLTDPLGSTSRGARQQTPLGGARIEERAAARAARDFRRADAIRDELAAQGIELEDTREGTRWRTARG